ncbi:energy-coupled thiamine transporter ThiT [Faecalimonas sp.]
MFQLLVNQDGGLTTAGYAITIIIAILGLIVALIFAGKASTKKKFTTKQLVYCAMALALGFATSYIKVFELPFGGAVTACSMLFIALIGYWYGPKTGILLGFVYGIMQFLQGPYVLSFFQVCCDYLLAFAALGLSGFFAQKKNGLIKGYLLAIIGRGAFHVLGGYLYWMDYMPDNFPKSLAPAYPFVYNYSFILAEGLITIIILSIPAVKKALEQVKRNALS